MTARTSQGQALQPGEVGRRKFVTRTAVWTLGTVASCLVSRHYGPALARAAEKHSPRPPIASLREKGRHEDYMRRAIALAKQVPRLPFGAVIVQRATGEIVAEGVNRSADSPTFHGEIDAINHCAAAHPSIDWTELDLYTTAEPCPMCQSAIEWAGIGTVYYGTSIPYLKDRGWWQIDIRAEEVARRTPFRQTRIVGGILESECSPLFDAALKGTFKD